MTLQGLIRSPKGAALVGMGASSALHFSAYEFSRSAIIALFTSEKTGFSSDGAMPIAIGCIGPFSLVLLWMYTYILETQGPRIALRSSTLLGVGSLFIGSGVMRYAESSDDKTLFLKTVSKICIFVLFVSQNALVQLLFTQHWAFLGTLAQGKKDSSAWFAPVAGIGSLASTVAASAVGPMADVLTLPGLLLSAALTMVLSGVAAEFAFVMAEKNGFDPHDDKARTKSDAAKQVSSKSLVHKTRDLFRRVPILGVLCGEVVFCQCLSAVVTFMFVRQVKLSIGDDQQRAGWTGNCYAWINGVSGVLQFCIIPLIIPHLDLLRLWPIMPFIMLLLLLCMSFEGFGNTHSLDMVAASFCTLKVLEYSLRGVANEMLFASLDYESRYVAKQEIALLANRFAKSFTAVALSLLTEYVSSSILLQAILSWTASVLAAVWLFYSYQLGQVGGTKAKEKNL